MARDIVNRQVNIFIQSGEAQKALDALIKKENSLKDALKAATDPKQVAALNLELKKLEEPLDRAKKKLSGEITPSFRDVQAAVNSLGQRMRRLSEEDADYSEVIAQWRQGQRELDGQREKIGLLSGAMRSFKDQAKAISVGVFVANAVQNGIQLIRDGISNIIGNSARLSDEFADIEKTTGLLPGDVQKLNAELQKMDTRTSAADLRELASEAGKLGKESVADVAKFVSEADKIKVALGEDLGPEAITDIAKTSGIFKTEMLNIASAINEIGANSAASESFSVDFLKRMAGIAPTVHLAADEVLGYSAALEIAGQTTEVSATSLNTFFIDFAKDTEKFGQAAGFAQGELTKLVQTKGTNEGFLQFLEKLKQANPDAEQFLKKMQDLGIDGARGANVMLALSNNIKGVREQQLIANEAIQSSGSIMNEFNKKNNNANAELDKLKKNFASLFESSTIAQAGAGIFRTLSSFINVLKSIPEFIEQNRFALLTLAAGIVLLNKQYVIAAALSIRDTAVKTANAIATRATAVASNVAGAASAAYSIIVSLLTGRLTLAAAAQRLWAVAMSIGAGPLGVILIAVGALAIALGSLVGRTRELTNLQKIQADLSQRVANATQDELVSLESLVKVASDSAVAEDTRAKALQKIIDLNPELLKGLTLENIKTQEGTDILNNYIKALKEKALIQAKADIVTEAQKNKLNAFASVRAIPGFQNITDADAENLIRGTQSAARGFTGRQSLGSLDADQLDKVVMGLDAIKAFEKEVDAFNAKKIVDQLNGNTNSITGAAGNAIGILEALRQKLKTLQEQQPKATSLKELDSINKQIKETEDQIAKLEGRTTSSGKAAKKSAEDFKELEKELRKIALELSVEGLPDSRKAYQLELAQLKEKYDTFRERAQGNKRLLLLIEQDYNGELEKIQNAHYRSELDRLNKLDIELRKKEEERLARIAKMSVAQLPAYVVKIASDINKDKMAQAELDVLRTQGRAKLEAEKRLLDLQERQELTATDLTEKQKQLIREKYRIKRGELEKNALLSEIQQALEFAKSAVNIYGIFADAKTARENAELERDRKLNDKKKQNLDRSLKSGLLSQLQHDRQVQEIEKQQEARDRETKLRQFKRAQRMQIAQAIINGAMAVTSTLAAIPGPLDIATLGAARAIQIGLAIATTGAEIATIAGQKPNFAKGGVLIEEQPKFIKSRMWVDKHGVLKFADGGILEEELPRKKRFARGGFLKGPSHAEGGIQLYSPNGHHFGEAEGEEGLINKKSMRDKRVYTITGTISQIGSAANAVNGGVAWESGAVLKPGWSQVKPKQLNYTAINTSVNTVRGYYASGGIVNAISQLTKQPQSTEQTGTIQQVMDVSQLQATLVLLTGAMENLQQQMQQPIKAYSVLTEQEVQQQRLDKIRDDAAMKPAHKLFQNPMP